MKNGKAKIAISIICILLLTAATVTAVHFARRNLPAPVTTESETEIVTDETTTGTTAAVTEPTSDEKDTTVLNIADSPEIGGEYEPTGFENKLFELINSEREKQGLKKLEYNSALHVLAKIRADESLTLWSHNRPDGRAPSSVFEDSRLSFSTFGECLARGSDETDGGAELLVEGLLKSDSQTDVIFSDEYDFFAVAVSENSDKTVSAALLFCKA